LERQELNLHHQRHSLALHGLGDQMLHFYVANDENQGALLHPNQLRELHPRPAHHFRHLDHLVEQTFLDVLRYNRRRLYPRQHEASHDLRM
jgi:hypothetical protein